MKRHVEPDPRDELAAARRERDEHREPRRVPPSARQLAARHAFQVALLADANGLVSLPCPRCQAPVCASSCDSQAHLDCYECDARLVLVVKPLDGGMQLAERDGAT